MGEDIRYAECDLQLKDMVDAFLEEIEEFLRNECFEEIEVREVADELSRVTPMLATILSKWAPEIIYGLYLRKMSFNDLKRMLPISSRVLSDKLKALEKAGIVLRVVEESRPPRVYYELTSFGKKIALSLIPLFVVVKRDDW